MSEEVACPQCGALNPSDSNFCENCGISLPQPSTPPRPAPEPSPISRDVHAAQRPPLKRSRTLLIIVAVVPLVMLVVAAMLLPQSISPTSNTTTTSTSTASSALAHSNVAVSATPLSTQQTLSIQALHSTKINVWAGYMGMPALWLSDPVNNPVKRSSEVSLRIWIDASGGKCPCRSVNYYIDNAAAGGTWNSKPSGGDDCCGGLSGGTGGLTLHSQDTAKLSPGWHTLKIDFLGDDVYAPSQWTGQFLVV